METLVIDASIAVKWVVEEDETETALGLRSRFRFLAPELMIAECANILWKKVQRGELVPDEARMASRLLERAGIEFVGAQGMLEQATDLAVRLSHPAYDCIYLCVARKKELRFVTADQRLLRTVSERGPDDLKRHCVSLSNLNDTSHQRRFLRGSSFHSSLSDPNTGIRVFDIGNPYRPEEVGVFVPPEPARLMDHRPNRKKVIQTCDALRCLSAGDPPHAAVLHRAVHDPGQGYIACSGDRYSN